MMNLKWNKEGEKKFRGGYGNGSRSSRKKQKKSDQERKNETAKSYNIQALWKQQDSLMISAAKSQEELDQSLECLPIDDVLLPDCHLSQVPRGGTPLQQVFRNRRVEVLKDLTKLLNQLGN